MTILTEKRVWRRDRSGIRTRSDTGELSALEQANVRRAVAHMVIMYRSRKALAKALRMTYDGLRKAVGIHRRQTMRLALAMAYAAGVRVESILSGAWPRRGACPWCGR